MITAVTIALVAVLVLLVGLPLAAVWWSKRAYWSRLRPGRERDLWGDVMRTHGLTPAQMARVENSIIWGRRLDDPRERAALVQLARAGRPHRDSVSRWRTPQLLLLVCWITAVVGWAVYAVTAEGWGEVNWFALVWPLLLGWLNAGPQLAIRRNSD